jgi:DNA-binding transcriptional MerR regulator/methylmalonyl-CoA mutase cobalamin-binding subunit
MTKKAIAPIALSIADVERDTGLSKDTLRVWERRYGFPRPRRDALGERSYAPAQVEKLHVIRRLMDAGHRPGALVARPLAELRALGDAERATPASQGARHDEVEALLALLRGHDANALRHGLEVAAAREGVRAFVVDVAAPLTQRVGEAWMHGELRIFEEHLYTECLESMLHAALNSLPAAHARPRVLLATVPGEPHGLGLLMAQSMLALDGSACLSLGVQVPIGDIVAAAAAWPADVVALSVTGCMKGNLVLQSLAQMRAQLPEPVELWVGGAAPALARRSLAGVTRVPTLEAVGQALRAWRAAAAPRPDA